MNMEVKKWMERMHFFDPTMAADRLDGWFRRFAFAILVGI